MTLAKENRSSLLGEKNVIGSIHIENFRGIREGKLEDLTPLVILTGPNGAGKSTVLDALLIAAGKYVQEEVVDCLRRRKIKLIGNWLVWRAKEKSKATIRVTCKDESQSFEQRVTLEILKNCGALGAAIALAQTES